MRLLAILLHLLVTEGNENSLVFPFLVCQIRQIILNMGLLFKQMQVWIMYLYKFGNIYLYSKFQYISTNYYLCYTCTNTGSEII